MATNALPLAAVVPLFISIYVPEKDMFLVWEASAEKNIKAAFVQKTLSGQAENVF